MQRFGPDWESFSTDKDYQSVAAFHLLQIGELVVKLSPEFRADTIDQINWTEIKGLRNIIAHDYGSVRPEILWEIVTSDIPALKRFCEDHRHEGSFHKRSFRSCGSLHDIKTPRLIQFNYSYSRFAA